MCRSAQKTLDTSLPMYCFVVSITPAAFSWRERGRDIERQRGRVGERERKRGGERQIETHFSQEYLNPQVWINKMVIGQSLPPKSFRVTHKNHCGPPRMLSQEYFVCWILSLLRQKMGGISNILLNRQHACLNYKQFKNF